MQSVTTRGRGRPPKYPREVTRQKAIDAGVAAVEGHGLEFGLDAATLEGAIIDADVPRGLSYRIWREETSEGDSPQDAFRIAVLMQIVHYAQSDWLPRCTEFINALVINYSAGKTTVREIMRQLGFLCHELSKVESLRLAHSLRVTAWSKPDTPSEIRTILREGQESLIDQYGAWFQPLVDAAGLRLRDNYKMSDVSEAFYCAGQSMTVSSPTNSTPREIVRATGPDGAEEIWTLGGVTFEALTCQFFHWDPDSEPVATS